MEKNLGKRFRVDFSGKALENKTFSDFRICAIFPRCRTAQDAMEIGRKYVNFSEDISITVTADE